MPTLVISGGKSPAWMQNGMKSLAKVLPNARHQTLAGQTHIVKPEAPAPVLKEFFSQCGNSGERSGLHHLGRGSGGDRV
jgi:pimeloyl-ACP methyl ester carboxylesterase